MNKANSALMAACLLAAFFAQATETNVKSADIDIGVNTEVRTPEPKPSVDNSGEVGAAVDRAMNAGPIINQPVIPAHSLPGSGAIDGQKPQND
jgi:hypothetical protein